MAINVPLSSLEDSTKPGLFSRFQDLTAARSADHDIQYVVELRKRYEGLTVTAIPRLNINLIAFAAAGHAIAELDVTAEDPIASWRGWVPAVSSRENGSLAQSVFFAKYHYEWKNEYFIVYTVGGIQYVLKEPRGEETPLSSSNIVDELIAAVGQFQTVDSEIVWVYDGYWSANKALWQQVQDAEWRNVILDESMKKALIDVSKKFFESKSVYEDLGVPWKRGVIFHGPAGNGKTISLKALMHTLLKHNPPILTLYVKSAVNTYQIRNIFTFARRLSPCLLVFEDIDTIVTAGLRSYFFNEVDGLESNDGILMVASTNHLDQLDPGLSKRPSRFDRKYYFPLPNEHERTSYAQFWRNKLQKKGNKVDFPERLCGAIAGITDGFSFAYLQEAFVASLLSIAREDEEERNVRSSNDDLHDIHLWQVFKEQVRILREDMDNSKSAQSPSTTTTIEPNRLGEALGEHLTPWANAMGRRQDATLIEAHDVSGDDLLSLPTYMRAVSTLTTMLDVANDGAVGVKRNFINSAAFQAK